VREDKCLVCVDIVAVNLVESVELRRSETGCCLAGCAEEEVGVEVASIRVRDDRVDYTISAVALTHYLRTNGWEERRRDVVGRCVRQVVAPYFGCPGLEVVCPPGRCTSDHAVEILWVKLKVLETLS
jgi:hypothetical protein